MRGCLPVQSVCILVCAHRQVPNNGQITEEEEPAQEPRPGEYQVDDEDDSEQQARLPGVESVNRQQLYLDQREVPRIPNIVAVALQDQQQNSPERRRQEIRRAGLVVQPEPQTRIKLADSFSVRVGRGEGARDAARLPLALRLRVLQGRRRGLLVTVGLAVLVLRLRLGAWGEWPSDVG